MKRALPGKKSKKATPARKLAAKRPTGRSKSKSAKPAAKKSASVKKVKTRAPKTKVTKSKIVQKKAATVKAAKPKRSLVTKRKAVKLSVAKAILPPEPKPNTVKAKVVRAKPTILDSRIKPVRATVAREVVLGVSPSGRVPNQAPTNRKVSQKAVRKVARKPTRKTEFTLPEFLLEGDEPSHPLSGSGEKFALGPTPPLDHFDEAKAPLPESYGTGRLVPDGARPALALRALGFHDAGTVPLQRAIGGSAHGLAPARRGATWSAHFRGSCSPRVTPLVHHVEKAGKKYFTEIGYYQVGRKWKSLAISEPQRTPPDNISADATIEFATIPLELPFETMLALLKEHSGAAAAENLPLARGIEQIRVQARQHFPQATAATDWTPEQEQALADILTASRAGALCRARKNSPRRKPGRSSRLMSKPAKSLHSRRRRPMCPHSSAAPSKRIFGST
jgi:hypothetical protein